MKKERRNYVTGIQRVEDRPTFHPIHALAPAITREVIVDNQFGKQKLTTYTAVDLAVPTQKQPHKSPQTLDHFVCYAAAGRRIGLSDQWRQH